MAASYEPSAASSRVALAYHDVLLGPAGLSYRRSPLKADNQDADREAHYAGSLANQPPQFRVLVGGFKRNSTFTLLGARNKNPASAALTSTYRYRNHLQRRS